MKNKVSAYVFIPLVLIILIKSMLISFEGLLSLAFANLILLIFLYLPGRIITNFLFNEKELKLYEAVSVSFALSIALGTVISFIGIIFSMSLHSTVIIYFILLLLLILSQCVIKKNVSICYDLNYKRNAVLLIILTVCVIFIGIYGNSLTGDPLIHLSIIRRYIDFKFLTPMNLQPINGTTFSPGYVYNPWHILLSIISSVCGQDPAFIWVNMCGFMLIIFVCAQIYFTEKLTGNLTIAMMSTAFIMLFQIFREIAFNVPAFTLSRICVPEVLNKLVLLPIGTALILDYLKNMKLRQNIENIKLFIAIIIFTVLNIIHMNFIIYMGIIYGLALFILLFINYKEKVFRKTLIITGVLVIMSFLPSLFMNIPYVKSDITSLQTSMQYSLDTKRVIVENGNMFINPVNNILILFLPICAGVILMSKNVGVINKVFVFVYTLTFSVILNNSITIKFLSNIIPIWLLYRFIEVIPIWPILIYTVYLIADCKGILNTIKFDRKISLFFMLIISIIISAVLNSESEMEKVAFELSHLSWYFVITLIIAAFIGWLIKDIHSDLNSISYNVITVFMCCAIIISSNLSSSMKLIYNRINDVKAYKSTYGYSPKDIIDGEWDESLIKYIETTFSNGAMVAVSNAGSCEVIVGFKDVNVLTTANATPYAELAERQRENALLFSQKTDISLRKEIIKKRNIRYIITTPSFKDVFNFENIQGTAKIYNKNGFSIYNIDLSIF